MIVNLTPKVRLRKMDPNNWVLEYFTGGVVQWAGFGGYYGTVDTALHALLSRHLDRLLDGEEADLQTLRSQLEEVLANVTHVLLQIEALQAPPDPLGL